MDNLALYEMNWDPDELCTQCGLCSSGSNLLNCICNSCFPCFLDGRNAEKVDFWGYAFAFRGIRGIPQWNHKMLQSHGFAVTAMLGGDVFLQAGNIVAYDLDQHKLRGC